MSERSLDAALACDVRRGLAGAPRSLPPTWFYDELGSAFAHRAVGNAGEERIERRLRSLRPQVVRLPLAGMVVESAAGEEFLTEVSCTFRRAGITTELDAAGWRVRGWWTDVAGDVALVLAARS